MSPFLSDCPSLMLGIAIHCIQHSQAMLEHGVCELAHSFFHFLMGQGLCRYLFYKTGVRLKKKKNFFEEVRLYHPLDLYRA